VGIIVFVIFASIVGTIVVRRTRGRAVTKHQDWYQRQDGSGRHDVTTEGDGMGKENWSPAVELSAMERHDDPVKRNDDVPVKWNDDIPIQWNDEKPVKRNGMGKENRPPVELSSVGFDMHRLAVELPT